MFFTIESVKNVLIYLHACPERNAALIADLRSAVVGLNVCWITRENNNWWQTFGIESHNIVAAASPAESRLFQNVLRTALAKQGFDRSNTVVVSSDPEILGAASRLLLGTIYLSLEDQAVSPDEYGPDFSVPSAANVKDVLAGKFTAYSSEYFSTPQDSLAVAKPNQPLLTYGSLPNDLTSDHFGGRYFSRGDSRHDLHALSLRIIDSKRNYRRQSTSFKAAFSFLIAAVTKGQFDYISHVPAKPEQAVDRFEAFLQDIHLEPDMAQYNVSSTSVNHNLLKCVKSYKSLKNFKAVERPDTVKGAFAADPAVKGKIVVLVDDVRTTGSTITECASTLLGQGAKEVIPITLAFKPFQNIVLDTLVDTSEYSSCCDWPGVIKFNGSNGEPFYGCSAWQQNDRIKHESTRFAKVTKYLLDASKNGLLTLDEELLSFIDF